MYLNLLFSRNFFKKISEISINNIAINSVLICVI